MPHHLADVPDQQPAMRLTVPAPPHPEQALLLGHSLAEVYAVAALRADSRPPEAEAPSESFLPTQRALRPTRRVPELETLPVPAESPVAA